MNSNLVLAFMVSKNAFIPCIANCLGLLSVLSTVSMGLVMDKETSNKITVGILWPIINFQFLTAKSQRLTIFVIH